MKLMLQSKAAHSSQTSKWRTIAKFKPKDQDAIDKAVRLLASVDEMMFRIVPDDQPMVPIAQFSTQLMEWGEPPGSTKTNPKGFTQPVI